MKLTIVLGFVAASAAAPLLMELKSEDKLKLQHYDFQKESDGNYTFSYAQTDGQKRKEQGFVKNAGTQYETIVVTGSYEWVAPDGVKYEVIYIADEDGYQVELQHRVVQASVSSHIASMLG